VHGIARLDDVDDVLGGAVDDGDLAGVTQGQREEVLPVAVVLGLVAASPASDELPRLLHL
jgi:hypothetical protein